MSASSGDDLRRASNKLVLYVDREFICLITKICFTRQMKQLLHFEYFLYFCTVRAFFNFSRMRKNAKSNCVCFQRRENKTQHHIYFRHSTDTDINFSFCSVEFDSCIACILQAYLLIINASFCMNY